MNTVSSRDGTTIAYDKVGEGPALILVDGALSVHSSGGKSELAKMLAPHLTVYGYDRRGRGGSGDTLPYPHNDDPDAQESWREYLRELGQVLADGRRGDAVALFMRFVGTPDDQVEGMRQAPFWPSMEAIAPTLAYDHAAIIGERWSAPTDLAARVSVPALVIAGDASLPFMPHTARALSQAMPQGHLRMLEGQTHDVNPGVLAPVLVDFFTS